MHGYPDRERHGVPLSGATQYARRHRACAREDSIMKCNEARKLLNPYLDSELDTKSNLEVEQHLASCTECAGLFEAESKFDARVRDALRRGERTPALWDAVELRLHPARHVIKSYRWALAAAAAIALLGMVWFLRAAQPLDL